MSSQNRIGIILAAVVAISALAVVLTHGSVSSASTATTPFNVQCAPTQRAVVHQAAAGTGGVTVECVAIGAAPAAAEAAPNAPTVAPAAAAPATQQQSLTYVPAQYYNPAPQPVYATPVATAPVAMAPAEAVYYPAAEAPRVVQPRRAARVVSEDNGPSKKERLLIIGGSAGAGAGIGALLGGKKGAGIGALIGGGGAAIVDQIRN